MELVPVPDEIHAIQSAQPRVAHQPGERLDDATLDASGQSRAAGHATPAIRMPLTCCGPLHVKADDAYLAAIGEKKYRHRFAGLVALEVQIAARGIFRSRRVHMKPAATAAALAQPAALTGWREADFRM